jgi:uncharacterized protein
VASRQVVHRWIGWYREEATRFAGTAMEHRTIFLVDRSNNVLELKQYEDPRLEY